RPEVSSIPDLLTELEQEIFRDEPLQDHPMPLSPVPEPLYPTLTEQPEEIEPVEAVEAAEPPLREVPVDSHQQVDFTDWRREPQQTPEPEPEPEPAPAAALEASPFPIPVSTSNAVFDQEPALRLDDKSDVAPAAPPRKPDTAMRIAVGLGAAAWGLP